MIIRLIQIIKIISLWWWIYIHCEVHLINWCSHHHWPSLCQIVLIVGLFIRKFRKNGHIRAYTHFHHTTTLPQIHPTNPTPVQATPSGRPPPPALPSEYDGNWSWGQSFLTSCQTYICLCPDLFPSEHIKITWALSYMKSRWAVKWAERIFLWEEKHEGYPKFLN